MKNKKQRFWLPDELIDIHAKHISHSALSVYLCLARRANAEGCTFVGIRRIAEDLNMSVATVTKVLKELEVYQLVKQFSYKRGEKRWRQVLLGVSNNNNQPYQELKPKEVIKENIYVSDFETPIEEEIVEYKGSESMLNAMRTSGNEIFANHLERKAKIKSLSTTDN